MTPFIVSIDSNPDPMLTGLLLGLSRGAFKKVGLDVQIVVNQDVSASNNAIVNVATKVCHLAVASSMALFKFHLSPFKIPLKAVAAPVQDNFYAFAKITNQEGNKRSKGFSKVGMPHDYHDVDRLFNRMFGHNMDHADMVRFVETEGLSDIEKQHVDFLFINTAWDAFIAKDRGLNLRLYPWPEDDLRLAYTPVYVGHPNMLESNKNLFSLFFKVADAHYCEASENPVDVAKELHWTFKNIYPNFNNLKLLQDSMQFIAHSFVDENQRWGCMKHNYWQELVLLQKRMLKNQNFGKEALCECHLDAYSGELFTNDYLPYDLS